MQLIERTKCAVTGCDDLEPLYEFKSFPIFMGCVNQPREADLIQDMSWWISRNSGLIQLRNLLPLEVLYPESHGAGAVGLLWERHHMEFARFVSKFSPSSVIEIGGGHGILAKNFNKIVDIPWAIVEPNPTPVKGCPAMFVKGFFDETFVSPIEFDTVVHSHVFEHIYEPDRFMHNLSGFLCAGDQLIFSLPNMQVMLERKYTNCINFEHTIFLTEPYIEFLLSKHGFRVAKKEYFLDDHSIFYAAVRDPDVKKIDLPSDLYSKNKLLYRDYIDYHKELINRLNQEMWQASDPVYLFGAHVFAQYLINMGLSCGKLVGVLDNDPNKQGRRLYGTDLKVYSPKVLSSSRKPIVVLKAGVYNDEIKQDIIENINKDVVFIG